MLGFKIIFGGKTQIQSTPITPHFYLEFETRDRMVIAEKKKKIQIAKSNLFTWIVELIDLLVNNYTREKTAVVLIRLTLWQFRQLHDFEDLF